WREPPVLAPIDLPDHLYVDRAVALPVVEIQQYHLLPGSERETALDDRDRLRGADDGRAHVRVGVGVVIEAVVLVVALRGDQPLGGEVLLVGTERLPVEAYPSLLEQAAALGPRQPEESLQQRRQVHGAVDRLEGCVLDLLRRLPLDMQAVEVLLGALRAPVVVE